jgi:hypothetical protein
MMVKVLALGLLLGWSGALVAQLPGRSVLPVLDFPEPGLDDPAAYQGYQTRFYRDSKQNTVQIYLEPTAGRVVTLWGNGANESAGFTVRDARGRPIRMTWDVDAAEVADVHLGWRRKLHTRSSAGSCLDRCASSATFSMPSGTCFPTRRHHSR